MADFTLSKSLFKGKHRDPSSLPGNIAYAVFVLFCFWAGAQILNLLAHAPGIYEQLMQLQMQQQLRMVLSRQSSKLLRMQREKQSPKIRT